MDGWMDGCNAYSLLEIILNISTTQATCHWFTNLANQHPVYLQNSAQLIMFSARIGKEMTQYKIIVKSVLINNTNGVD